jgi:hypothetical protein
LPVLFLKSSTTPVRQNHLILGHPISLFHINVNSNFLFCFFVLSILFS